MKKEIYLSILGIAIGEIMLFLDHIHIGLLIHIINILIITSILIFSDFSSDSKKVLQSLILLLLMRAINLAMPQLFENNMMWYLLTYGVMFIPIYLLIKNQQISLNELGIHSKNLRVFLPAALLIGIVLSYIEFLITDPAPLIGSLQPLNIILLVAVMFIFVGGVEELIFRSILQTRLENVFGLNNGIYISGLLFGIMHSVYGLVPEIIFAIIYGIIIGYIFQKTRSLPFILAIHGTANVFLFGIFPALILDFSTFSQYN
ncbi:MAG: CPBP family intramembrane glutamic endopeptidase [Bacteroidota bacterium]